MKVTQEMVARRAGVDRSTVSYALSGRPMGTRVSRAVIERIQLVARELNYAPNHQAQALVTGRSRTIALMIEGLGGSGLWLWGEAAEGAESALFEAGQQALLARYRPEEPLVTQAEALVREGRADGVVALLWSGQDQDATLAGRLEFPLIFININRTPGPRRVSNDVTTGLGEAVEHLHALGHRRLLWIRPRGERGGLEHREACVRTHARGKGMHVHADGVTMTGLEVTVNFARAQPQLLDDLRRAMPDPLDASAILCWNDYLAYAVCAVLRERGLRIPVDVSVVGFDDMQPSASVPPLTTVSGAYRELGREAAKLAMRLAESRDCGSVPPAVAVPTYLVVRGSTSKRG